MKTKQIISAKERQTINHIILKSIKEVEDKNKNGFNKRTQL